jgi:hypothetical protein
MKMTPIVIAGHWATGSRLLCEVFEVCGMWLGDEESGWYRTSGMDHPNYTRTITRPAWSRVSLTP